MNFRSLSFSRAPFFLLVGFLLVVGIVLTLHRHWMYEVPLMYGETQTIWSVEAKVEFNAHGGPVKVSMARPSAQDGFTVLKEAGASPGYGLNFMDGNEPRAEWTVRGAKGKQELFYRAEILVSQMQSGADLPPPAIDPVSWPEPYASAVSEVLAEAYATSADNYSLTRELLKRFREDETAQHIELLRTHYSDQLPELWVEMLHKARVPASVVYGLNLQDGRRRQNLMPLLRVWNGNDSQIFELPGEKSNASVLLTADTPLLLWEQRGAPVLDVTGGTDSSIRFSMLKREESTYANIAENLSSQHDFLNFSIHSLPVEEQAMFKTILLIPIGALIVCILRIIIGIRTSGTFMPVLIALAFIQTSLVTGLVGFLLVVATGLFIRGYLSRLNLLLVARITAVIITVIAIISIFSVLSYKLGLTEGLKITFFPMIILSWTIERMSILWEEEGGREVMVQGGGSLLTAVLAYWAMSDPWVRHLTFNFIGIQFIVLALVLLIGSYTGYRLLELKRFKAFGN
ncbi:inactive transglutaminase family protein [Thalassolituus hydrocarboniclasticus]|uniref:Inactive transglutaminase family protein n=1 Tax=Thalassolituus hydrocarboniclasticus TaxID=2742796 RepID=A0ABY6ABZ2_9GAMM|nr:inactive transglutaminase family protein [Thalassolituus hydrocarboniclasticus]UXD88098.1 inactive transglutaminase family protein [Thalassolituus hydrocarboniclasticus]